MRRLTDSLASAVPGAEAPGAADMDVSIFSMIRRLSENVAHSVGPDGYVHDGYLSPKLPSCKDIPCSSKSHIVSFIERTSR